MSITEKTTFGMLKQVEEFSSFSDFLLVQEPEASKAMNVVSIEEACGNRTGTILDALVWMQDQVNEGRVESLDIWSEEEKEADPGKKMTNLLYIQGQPDQPYAIVCAGGAYVMVCNALEGFPAAKVLSEKGYHVFVLTYRVGEAPLLPKPQEDLAAAVRLIEAHAKEYQILSGDYCVVGFSAGAHLAASFGSDNIGYAYWGVPKPTTLMLAYPAPSAYTFDEEYTAGTGYINVMIGTDWTEELLSYASVERNMSEQYPSVFITHSKDDGTVPFRSSLVIVEQLEQLGIPYIFKPVNGCDHGFVTGFGEAEGWMDEAITFFETQRNHRFFQAERVNDHIIRIEGACREYMYLVEGSEYCCLLDTGTGIGSLKAFVDELTDKPVKVLLTHGHMDHALGAWFYDEIYMDPADDQVLKDHSQTVYRKSFVEPIASELVPYVTDAPVPSYHPITNGDTWDLGGITIQAFACHGHTVGSVCFLIVEDRLMLLGDACNSNTLVYDPAYSTTVEAYHENLIHFREETEGLYDHTIFSHETTIKGTNIIPDMIELTGKVMDGISDEEPVQFGQDTGLLALKRNKTVLSGGESDVNIMYLKERIFEPER